MLSINLDIGNVVLEDSWDIDLWECALGEDDQEAGLSASAISYDNEFSSNLSHLLCIVRCCGEVFVVRSSVMEFVQELLKLEEGKWDAKGWVVVREMGCLSFKGRQ
jgi:hypothetical protein